MADDAAGWGSNGCCNGNRQAGCCNSCCGDSFDEDAFDKEVKKDMEKTRASTSADDKPATTEQPTSGQAMTIPTTSSLKPVEAVTTQPEA
ncbi:hypothetical protein C0995_009366 [Termitomyces sp. Mi166|nr:hypothetical protein C0995_009366 [Termitomyces sp. Mi166\